MIFFTFAIAFNIPERESGTKYLTVLHLQYLFLSFLEVGTPKRIAQTLYSRESILIWKLRLTSILLLQMSGATFLLTGIFCYRDCRQISFPISSEFDRIN